MKLKEIITIEDELKPKIYRNYNDYIESDIPENSIELDEDGRIISNKLSLLNFIEFLLSQYDFLHENNNIDEMDNNRSHKLKKKKSKKKKHNNDSSDGLSLKQKKKRIQNMDHFLNSKSNYPD